MLIDESHDNNVIQNKFLSSLYFLLCYHYIKDEIKKYSTQSDVKKACPNNRQIEL